MVYCWLSVLLRSNARVLGCIWLVRSGFNSNWLSLIASQDLLRTRQHWIGFALVLLRFMRLIKMIDIHDKPSQPHWPTPHHMCSNPKEKEEAIISGEINCVRSFCASTRKPRKAAHSPFPPPTASSTFRFPCSSCTFHLIDSLSIVVQSQGIFWWRKSESVSQPRRNPLNTLTQVSDHLTQDIICVRCSCVQSGTHSGAFVRHGELWMGECQSEFGIYGAILASKHITSTTHRAQHTAHSTQHARTHTSKQTHTRFSVEID